MTTAEYTRFLSLLKQNALADALTLAERQCVATGDKNEFWLTQLSHAFYRTGKFTDAVKSARKALALAPSNRYALLALADGLGGAGEYDAALEAYLEALDQERTVSRARRGALTCLMHQKQWQRMLDLIASWGIAQTEGARFRIRALSGLDRLEEARQECLAWLQRTPDNPQALWELTGIEVRLEGLEPVRARMARLARIPGKPPVYREIYASLSRRSGNTLAAVEQYEHLARQEGNPRILRKQAFALAKSGREREALPVMEELLRLDPKDMYIHSAYSAACQRIDDCERAWKFYHDLIALHPDEKALLGRLKRIRTRLEESRAGDTEGERA